MAKVITLPRLEQWQLDVYNAMADSRGSGRIFVVKSKRQVGKSIVAICIMIKFCLEKKCVSVCVEPTLAHCRRVFKQINDFLEGSGAIESANSTLLTIQFANGSELLFKSAEQGDIAARGWSVSGVLVIDEAAFISNDLFPIYYATTDANNSPILVISTPLFMEGEFYELYMRGLNGDERVESFDWSEYDTSVFLSKEKLEYYRQTINPIRFRSEYEGFFITQNGLLFQNLENCIGEADDTDVVYIGIDFATGAEEDYTAMAVFNDKGQMMKIYRTNNLTPMQQVDWLSSLILDWAEHHEIRTILAECNSIGAVYIDAIHQKLRSKSLKITDWTTSNKSKQDLVSVFAIALENERVSLVKEPNLLNELRKYQAEVNPRTKTITYNGYGAHDDMVIATMLAYYAYYKGLGTIRIRLV